MISKPLDQLVVVELVGSIAGGYAAKLLADRGAKVTLVDPAPPPLDAANAAWHFLHGGGLSGEASQGASGYAGKTVVSELGDLAETADLVIESSAPSPLRPVVAARDGLTRLHLSPHGSTGVYADFQSTDLTDWALSGHQHLYGDPNRHPIPGPPNQPAYAAGLFGCVGAMAAMLGGEPVNSGKGSRTVAGQTAAGQTVEVSHVEAMVALHQFTLLRHQFGHDILTRMGNRFTGQGEPNTIYRCADGWVAVTCVTDQQMESLLNVIDRAWVLDEIDSPQDLQLRPELINDGLVPWLAERARDEVVELLQALRIPACPALAMKDLLGDAQLADRQWWEAADGLQLPGPPTRLSRHPWAAGRTPAATAAEPVGPGPLLGRVGHHEADPKRGPLSGLRVLDLTRVWAGPLAARILADLGADVVMVEAPWNRGPKIIPASVVEVTKQYPDNDPGERHWNRFGHTNKYAVNKRSLVLDLTKDEGPETFRRLVAGTDVVIENYSPRVMPQFGLADVDLAAVNPDTITVTMPGYGRTGPARDWVAYGSCLDSHAGLTMLTGYADDHPWKGGVAWPDAIAGLHAVVGILVAVWDRAAGVTRGQTVEVAQFESMVNCVGDQLVAAQLGGEYVPAGGRHATQAPHGVYRCLGNDRWTSISVANDEQWSAVVALMALPSDWAALSQQQRHDRHDEIDEAITEWTSSHDHMLVMYRLQEVGVAAGAVLDAAGVRSDPQLNSRALLETIEQPEVGPFTLPRTPIRLNDRYPKLGPAPGLGQHNDAVLGDAGIDEAARSELRALGVVADEPPG